MRPRAPRPRTRNSPRREVMNAWPGWSVCEIRATFAPDDPGAAHSLFRRPLGRHDRIIYAAGRSGKRQKACKLLKLLVASRSVIRNKTHETAPRCFPDASQFD